MSRGLTCSRLLHVGILVLAVPTERYYTPDCFYAQSSRKLDSATADAAYPNFSAKSGL